MDSPHPDLFLTSDGALYAREPWRVIREGYSFTHQRIKNTLQLRATLRNGPHAWPGGYPLFLLTSDGEAMHLDCARSMYRSISNSIRHRLHDGWRVVGCDINYEDPHMDCCVCNKRIESAYADEEDES